MLLLWITILALASAVGALLGAGPVAGLITFVCSWIGWLIFALIVLVVACLAVDKTKEPEKDSKFYRAMAHLYIQMIVTLGRLKVICKGAEKLPKDGRILLVCNHLSDIDPALLLYCFPKGQLAFISKRENEKIPLVSGIMHKLMCQSINRENDREALKTILKCIQIIKEDKASIAVFPEGYVSLDGKLRHFRGGVFKIAQKTGVPVVVCTLQNTKVAMDRLLKLKPAQVEVHLVEVISAEEAKSMSTVELGERVYESMIADLGEEYRTYEKGMHPDLQKQRMQQ